MKSALILVLAASLSAIAQSSQPRHVDLLCHRTANKDVPENTLASLRQAALFGCDIVEVDVRRTLDGRLVLNHDGDLERLTDGIGEVETTYADELELLDAGSWMGERFTGLKIPSLESGLRLAKQFHLKLFLDMKDTGMEADTLELLRQQDMLGDARFAGEPDEIKHAHPQRILDDTDWLQPGVSTEQINASHLKGKAVVINFSESGHDMDLAAMKAAVIAGADGINVDYPRLGADAVGRSVETHIASLLSEANTGEPSARAKAILDLGEYRNFDFKACLLQLLLNPDDHISRAAAIVLVRSHPQPAASDLLAALHSSQTAPRANAAWALGVLKSRTVLFLPLLRDSNEQVLQSTLSALAHVSGNVPLEELAPLLSHKNPAIRGTAALALAKHHPAEAVMMIRLQLQHEVKDMASMHADWEQRGHPPLTEAEKQHIVSYYRCQMQEVKALSMLPGQSASHALEQQAFRPGKDFSAGNGVLAALLLWDRIGIDPRPAIDALSSSDPVVADHAEWMLIQGGAAVLPSLRQALATEKGHALERVIHILAFQGDTAALPALATMLKEDPSQPLLDWAISKIKTLHPEAASLGQRSAISSN
jgi:HEAT repeat protein